LKWLYQGYQAQRNLILADEMGLGKTVQVRSGGFSRHGAAGMPDALKLCPASMGRRVAPHALHQYTVTAVLFSSQSRPFPSWRR